jgi:hypothetical protein
VEPLCKLSDVPSTLEDVFELNLKRVFGKDGYKFEQVRHIFEVLTAVTRPITEVSLIEISNIDHDRTNIVSNVTTHLFCIIAQINNR